jgi:hypothetical protein
MALSSLTDTVAAGRSGYCRVDEFRGGKCYFLGFAVLGSCGFRPNYEIHESTRTNTNSEKKIVGARRAGLGKSRPVANYCSIIIARPLFPAAFASDLGHVFTVLADFLSALAADGGHVFAVATDGFAAFARRFLPTVCTRAACSSLRCLLCHPIFPPGISKLCGYVRPQSRF